jgi:uncharacterized protein (TIGR02117 family)
MSQAVPSVTTKVVYLVSHGWHVGIAVARADVPAALWPESADLGDVRYLEVGWGDGAFYPAPHGTVGLALKAALSSESSVLHVAGFDAPVAEFFAGTTVIAVPVSSGGVDALSQFIHDGYVRDADGRPTIVAPGLYGASRFYRAAGRYRLFDNSNTWTARALRAAGCPIDADRIITAGAVLEGATSCARTGSRAPRPRRASRRQTSRASGSPGLRTSTT